MIFAFIIIIILYLIAVVALASSIRIRQSRLSEASTVSIVIPAKNEERDISRCLKSLSQLSYPADRLESILVDHRSDDRTLDLMKAFREKSPFPVKIVEMKGTAIKYPGKAEALNAGIAEASGKVLAFLDAECKSESIWLQTLIGALEDGVECVGGGYLIEGETLFAKLQKLEVLNLTAVSNALSEMGLVYSLFGKNMAIKRELFFQVGGFSQNKTWTEDLELVKKCAQAGKVRMLLSKENFIYSVPESGINAFIRQRLRWLKGGLNIGARGLVILFLEMIFEVSFIVGILIDLKLALGILLVKILGDFLILRKLLKELSLNALLPLLPIYALFSLIYRLTLLIILPFKRDLKWR